MNGVIYWNLVLFGCLVLFVMCLFFNVFLCIFLYLFNFEW